MYTPDATLRLAAANEALDLASQLGNAEAAAQLLPLVEPFAADVAFNGVTS